MRAARLLPTLLACLLGASPALAQTPGARVSLRPLPPAQWDREAAAHLLRRAGFGGTPAEIDRLFGMGLEGAVSHLVDYDRIAYSPPPPSVDPLLTQRVDRRELRNLSDEERRQRFEQRQRAERRTFEETRLWWVERLAESPRPFEERMTLFWHGHFTSGFREVRQSVFMKEQNELLRRRALDNFGELVLAISRDRAMLAYLDGNRNVARQPNENYARELLELFTLGVGNYSEGDIRAAARAFTGWSFDDDGFAFRRGQHDAGRKTFLGRSGNFGGDDVVRIILEHPACARHLARKLLEYFVRPRPERALVEALAREIRRHNYEMRPIMRTLLSSQAFYDSASRGCLVKSPVDVVIGTARQLGVGIDDPAAAVVAMTQLGQELMQPPSVKGWDGGPKWINTATLFTRYNVVSALIHGRPIGPGRERLRRLARESNDEVVELGGASMMVESAGMSSAPVAPVARVGSSRSQPAFDPLADMRRHGLTSAEQVVDFYAANLLAAPLHDLKRRALVEYLSDGGDGVLTSDRAAAERIRRTIHLMCSTPEFQLY